MKATQELHDLGQSLWLDNITRDLLESGTLERYIAELVGDRAHVEPDDLRPRDQGQQRLRRRDPQQARAGRSGEALFFELALEDITRAADLFRPVYERTARRRRLGVARGLAAARLRHHRRRSRWRSELHARAGRPNLFIKIPGTTEGLPAIEEAIFAGVPVNVTLLFSREQYVAAAEAYLRGIERRIAAGLPAERRLGGLGVHQPLGRRGGRQGAGGARQPPGHRHRPALLQGLLRPRRLAALPAGA